MRSLRSVCVAILPIWRGAFRQNFGVSFAVEHLGNSGKSKEGANGLRAVEGRDVYRKFLLSLLLLFFSSFIFPLSHGLTLISQNSCVFFLCLFLLFLFLFEKRKGIAHGFTELELKTVLRPDLTRLKTVVKHVYNLL